MTPFTRRRKITLAAAILPVPPGNQKAAFGATFGSFQRNAKLWLIILIPLYSCGNTFVKFIQSIHEAVEVGGIAPPDSWMISQNPHYATPTASVLHHAQNPSLNRDKNSIPGNRKIPTKSRDFLTRRPVELNHIPQSGTIWLSISGQSRLTSASSYLRRIYSTLDMNKNNISISEDAVSDPLRGNATLIDNQYRQYITRKTLVKRLCG